MKDFIKMVLAVVCGMIIMSSLGFFLFFGTIGALASMGDSPEPVMPRSGALYINMSDFIISEQAQEIDFKLMLNGDNTPTLGLYDAVKAIKDAATDPKIEYIFLKSEGVTAGNGEIQEVRKALEYFRTSGKPIISYIENPTTGAYYLASVADKVYMGSYHGGNNMFFGINSQMYFLKDLLDVFGVNVQLIRHGKYKSAGEMFVKNKPSAENVEQTQVMVNSLWKAYADEIAESRKMDKAELDALIDNLKLNFPEDWVDNGLADELVTKDELQQKLTAYSSCEHFKDLKMIKLSKYIDYREKFKVKNNKQKIAVIYANGEIVDGSAKENIAGDRFARIVKQVREDSTIMAVVLRVNSPGGSVLASEKIKTEIDLLKDVKPIVASYGDFAASGGYWISNNCDHIFANPATLTGSIGVFAMIPEFGKTAHNLLKVGVKSISSNKHGDMYSLMRPFDKDETEYIQESIEDIYEKFVSKVSQGRNLDSKFVDSIAQGRVWAGLDAMEIGLIDEFGTLDDAIAYAESLAEKDPKSKTAEYQIEAFPKPMTTSEMILSLLSKDDEPDISSVMKILGKRAGIMRGPVKNIVNAYSNIDFEGNNKFYARMPYSIVVK